MRFVLRCKGFVSADDDRDLRTRTWLNDKHYRRREAVIRSDHGGATRRTASALTDSRQDQSVHRYVDFAASVLNLTGSWSNRDSCRNWCTNCTVCHKLSNEIFVVIFEINRHTEPQTCNLLDRMSPSVHGHNKDHRFGLIFAKIATQVPLSILNKCLLGQINRQ